MPVIVPQIIMVRMWSLVKARNLTIGINLVHILRQVRVFIGIVWPYFVHYSKGNSTLVKSLK